MWALIGLVQVPQTCQRDIKIEAKYKGTAITRHDLITLSCRSC